MNTEFIKGEIRTIANISATITFVILIFIIGTWNGLMVVHTIETQCIGQYTNYSIGIDGSYRMHTAPEVGFDCYYFNRNCPNYTEMFGNESGGG